VLGVPALTGLVVLPAVAVSHGLRYWVRPAQRLALEEAWVRRFEDHLFAVAVTARRRAVFED
jgi:hypothetical protein